MPREADCPATALAASKHFGTSWPILIQFEDYLQWDIVINMLKNIPVVSILSCDPSPV